jgi:MFS family permease
MLFMNRLIHGLAFGVASTATGTIAAEVIPDERRGEGTGYFAMSMNLAMAIGPFLGLFITQHFSYSVIFVSATVFSIVSLLATMLLRVPKRTLQPQQPKVHNVSMKFSDFFEKSALPVSALVGIAGFAYSSVLSFITSYSQEIDLVSAASYFFVMYAVFLLASRPFTGRWFDKYGENVVIFPSILLFAIGLLLISQAHIGIILLIAGALFGIGFGTFQSSTQAIVVKKAPHHRMSLATSTYFSFYDFGIGVGPFLLGFVIPFVGFRGLYLAMAILAFACMFIYYLVHGKNVSKHKKNDIAPEQK